MHKVGPNLRVVGHARGRYADVMWLDIPGVRWSAGPILFYAPDQTWLAKHSADAAGDKWKIEKYNPLTDVTYDFYVPAAWDIEIRAHIEET